MFSLSKQNIASFALGIAAAFGVHAVIASTTPDTTIHATGTDDVHVHADWLVMLDHEQYRFTEDRYQSPGGDYKHEYLHLHSGDDHVIHRHADDAPMGEFLESIGLLLDEDETCLQTDLDTEYCETDTKQLLLYVNGEPVDSIAAYEFQDEDQMLLYYGDPNDERVSEYLDEISDEACLYSGTCPERGVAPPTDCGITCEA